LTEIRAFRVGIAPLFLLTLGLSRSEVGVHLSLSFHIYKFGLHMGLSSID